MRAFILVTKCCRISVPLLERSAAGFLCRFGNEVLPDFFKASAASFCRSAFILATKCCRIFLRRVLHLFAAQPSF
jgi:hypothetical protein